MESEVRGSLGPKRGAALGFGSGSQVVAARCHLRTVLGFRVLLDP